MNSSEKRGSASLGKAKDPQRLDFLLNLLDISFDALVAFDSQGRITSWNHAAEQMYGWNASEALGKTVTDLFWPTETDADRKDREQEKTRLLQGETIRDTHQHCRKDGSFLWVEYTTRAYFDSKGGILGFMAAYRDIAERKKTQDEVLIVSKMPAQNPYPVMLLSPDGKILYSNSAATPILKSWDLQPDQKIREELKKHVAEAFSSNNKKVIEIEHNEKQYSCTLVPIPESGYVNFYGNDITERKQAEKALQESEERLRVMFESTVVGFALLTPETKFTEVNNAFCQIVGYSRDELLNMNCATLTHPLDIEVTNQRVAQLLAGEIPSFVLEKIYIRKDGTEIWAQNNISLVRDVNGAPLHLIALCQDITERKRYETNTNFLAAVSDELMHLSTPREIMHSIGKKIKQHFNASRLTFSKIDEVTDEATIIFDIQDHDKSTQTVKVQMSRLMTMDYIQKLHEGKVVAIHDVSSDPFTVDYLERYNRAQVRAYLIAPFVSNEKINFIIAIQHSEPYHWRPDEINILQEITSRIHLRLEQARAQQSVLEYARQQEALYQLADQLHHVQSMEDVFTAALDAIFNALQCDRASILLFDETQSMHFVAWRGLSDDYRKATDGHSPWTVNEINPQPVCMDDIETADLSDWLKDVIRNEGIGALAFIPLIVYGKLIGKFMVYFNSPHSFSETEVDLSMTIAHQLAFGVDRKRAASQLLESEERYRTIVDTANEGIWYVDLHAVTIYLNEPMASILGYSASEIIGKSVPEFCFEEDVPLAQARIGSNYQGNYEHFDFVSAEKTGPKCWFSPPPALSTMRRAISSALLACLWISRTERRPRKIYVQAKRYTGQLPVVSQMVASM